MKVIKCPKHRADDPANILEGTMKGKIIYPLIIFLLFFFVSAEAKENQKPEWKGKIREIDGIKIIMNPEAPMYSKDVIKFEKELTIGLSEGPSEYLFGDISSYCVDDEENVYVWDFKENQIYMFNNRGKYVRSIGREGQGPGEYQIMSNIQIINKNEIAIFERAKPALIIYAKNGTIIKEIKNLSIANSIGSYIDADGNIYMGTSETYISDHISLVKLNSKFERIMTITKYYSKTSDKKYPPQELRYILLPDNNIAWAITSEYEISIVNSQGKIVKKITKKYKRARLSDAFKDIMLKKTPIQFRPGLKTRFADYFPAFNIMCADDDNWLYVETFEKEKATDNIFIDIFDGEGRYIARNSLKIGEELTPRQEGKLVIKKNKIYVKDFNEDGFPVITRYLIKKSINN